MKKGLTLCVAAMMVMMLMQGCVSTGSRKEDPEKASQLYAELGLQYLRQGNLELALVKLEHSLELNSKNPDANHYIAEVYKQTGDMELAEEYFDKAVRYDPDNPMLLNNFGAFLCEQKHFEKSETFFLRAAKAPHYRTPELAYENLALCALQSNNKEKAEEYFRDALKIRPTLPNSLYQMAQLSYDKHDYFKARAFIERFHAIGQTEQSIKLAIKIEQALGDEAAVAKYRERLKTNFPQATQE
jgi:type IV pilus assembly protein PilF